MEACSPEVTRQAITDVLDNLKASNDQNLKPAFCLIFASSVHSMQVISDCYRDKFPDIPLAACQTAGEYTERGLTHGGVSGMMIYSDEIICGSGSCTTVEGEPDWIATELSRSFQELADRSRKEGLGLSSSILLLDCLYGNGDRIVKSLQKRTRMYQSIIGGAAGDDGSFKTPWVASEHSASPKGAVAIHAFHRSPWGVGVGHGLSPKTPLMKVNKASGNVLFEIDGKPAFEAYRAYAQSQGIDLHPTEAASYMINNELGVYLMGKMHHARAPLRVGPNGELHLAAEVNTGAQVCILDGNPNDMVQACRQAAVEAKQGLGGKSACAVLVFDCVCRGMILGRDFGKEVSALAEVFPDVPVLGFLTYGEIARTGGRLDGWHNTTSVVVAIPA